MINKNIIKSLVFILAILFGSTLFAQDGEVKKEPYFKTFDAKERYYSLSNNNAFLEILTYEQIQGKRYLTAVGEKIAQRDSFYDKIYYMGVSVLDSFLRVGVLLVPMTIFLFLLPPVIYGMRSKEKKTFKDYLVYIGLFIALAITLRVGYFYATSVYASLGTFFGAIFKAYFFLLVSVAASPLVLIIVMSMVSFNEKGFELYADGTMFELMIELTKIHLLNIGIDIDVDKEMIILGFKLILLVLILKNVRLAINAIFITASSKVQNSFYVVSVLALFLSLYFFNQELMNRFAVFALELTKTI
jgi:hypothetical protein